VARIGVLPFDGLGGLVVLPDVEHQLLGQVAGGFEDAASDDLALQLVEPELDLVQPAGVGRREMQAHIGVTTDELIDQLGLVGREVVENDVDLAIRRLLGDQGSQEGDEFRAGVVLGGLALDLTTGNIQGGVQRKGSITHVFEAVTLGSPRLEGQHWEG